VAIRVKPNAAGIRRGRPGFVFKRAFEIELALESDRGRGSAAATAPPRFRGGAVRNSPRRSGP